MSDEKEFLQYPERNLQIELDPAEIFPDDPGLGTPAMVNKLGGRGGVKYCATYNAALNTGELGHNEYELTQEEYDWLEEQQSKVEAFIDNAEEGKKEVYMHFKIRILMDEDQKVDIVADIERTLKHYCIDAGFVMEWKGEK